MQRRDWSYKDGYKPRWIIYCTAEIAPMIVEGAEIVTTKPRDIRQLASECSQIMAGVYYVVTLAT